MYNEFVGDKPDEIFGSSIKGSTPIPSQFEQKRKNLDVSGVSGISGMSIMKGYE